MPDSRLRLIRRRVFAWSIAWVVSAMAYLLLIDNIDLPELLVGIAAATLAATAAELAREQAVVGEAIRLRWLLRLYRPMLKVPSDIAIVSFAVVRQIARPQSRRGSFRAVPFRASDDELREAGRASLAEAFGSFAPNTIIVGIDEERELILAHQIVPTEGADAIDVLELG
jgi:multisubunit Na+/H+ antiporter MnhE subunit